MLRVYGQDVLNYTNGLYVILLTDEDSPLKNNW